MTSHALPPLEELVRIHGLRPLPREGGLFRRTWAGPERPDGRPAGSAVLLLLAAEGGHFSALHRLPRDEIWHFHLGDPVELLLLEPGGRSRLEVLGPGLLSGQRVQCVVPGGVWMGARVRSGGARSLLGCTMAPGFADEDYEPGDPEELAAGWPDRADLVRALCRTAGNAA